MDAPDWFPDDFLSEMVMLGERGCRPLVPSGGSIEGVEDFLWRKEDFADLEYLHELGSEKWLIWLDQVDSLHYEREAHRSLELVGDRSECTHGLKMQMPGRDLEGTAGNLYG
jgi:hypothetical protein